MKTKILTSMNLSGKSLAVVVTINQIENEKYEYTYQVIIKELRNSFNRDNTEHVLEYIEYEDALNEYIVLVEQYARHIAIVSL